MLNKIAAGILVTGMTLGAFAITTMEPSVAAPAPKMAIKHLVCKKGEVAYKVKVGHHWVWRCHAVPHHHHVTKPVTPKKPLPPKKP